MVINVDVNRRELRQADLCVEAIEEMVWEMVGEAIDPHEQLNVDLNINVFD